MGFYIIIRGPLGCGKSTISERIAEIYKAHYVAVDRVLDEHGLTEDKEDGYISQKSFLKVNDIVAPDAQKALEHNQVVIFDGNFYWKSQLDDLINRLDFPHYVFTLKAPVELCIARDAARDKTHGQDAAKAVYEKTISFEYGKSIDATGSIDDTIKKIRSFIKEH